MSAKFFEFNQNNSGGIFDVDESVCHRVFIEAETAAEANDKAQSLGIYFNGVSDGRDCPCCGCRWDERDDDDAITFPLVYSKSQGLTMQSIEEYAHYLADHFSWTTPDVRIFYADGTVKEIYAKTLGAA